jgi:hypothetical protein
MYTKMEYFTMLLVVGMVAIAEHYGINEVIFPEIAALAFGAWVMEERAWPGPAWTIWLSPTLGAATGVLLLRLLPVSLPIVVAVAFVFVLLELRLLRSAMSPSISAAILPVIAGIRSWTYPLAVCLMTAAIAWLSHRRDRAKNASPRPVPAIAAASEAGPGNAREWLHYGKLVFFVSLLAVLSQSLNWLYMIAPPLIVAFVEIAHPDSPLREKSMKRLLVLLTGCALSGMAWVVLVSRVFSGPLWLAAGLSVATAFLLAKRLGLAAPPAFALALLPTILPPQALFAYPLHVLLGGLLFIGISLLWFRTASAAA